MTSSTSGLGRGLAAILTGPDTPAPTQSVAARLVATALDTLQSGGARQLCGYLHRPGPEVELHLRAPEARSLHPTQAYRLFSELSTIVRHSPGCHPFTLDELRAIAVIAETRGERGMFFFGDDDLDDATRRRLATFAAVFAPVLFDHLAPATDDERLHLVLDQDGATAHAEVTLAGTTGFGSAASSHDAIAMAAIAAVAPDAKLSSVGEVRGDDGAAAFVVAAGEAGRLRMSAAPIVPASGAATAVAVASIRAARALR